MVFLLSFALFFPDGLVSLLKAFGRGESLTDALLRCLTYPPAVALTSVQAFLFYGFSRN